MKAKAKVKVSIGSDAHRVEVEADVATVREVTAIAQTLYDNTVGKKQPMGMGFGSQHLERTHDRRVPGEATRTDPPTASR